LSLPEQSGAGNYSAAVLAGRALAMRGLWRCGSTNGKRIEHNAATPAHIASRRRGLAVTGAKRDFREFTRSRQLFQARGSGPASAAAHPHRFSAESMPLIFFQRTPHARPPQLRTRKSSLC
jgi:hypothetical protein